MKKNKLLNFDEYGLFRKLLIVTVIILVIPIAASIPPYPCSIFGSKVIFGDADKGNPLNQCCHNLGFYDIGKEKHAYDEGDPVYLDMNEDGIISINDVRITPFTLFMPGSKVTLTDIDINAPLINFTNWSIAYIDLNADNIYSLNDPLYLHDRNRGNRIVRGDVRLTFFRAYIPGTRVLNYSADVNSSCIDLMGVNPPKRSARVIGIRFFNANGNYRDGSAVYDWPDAVYLHILDSNDKNGNGVVGFVGSNDLRLSL